ncbi:MAG: UDP-3-O-[3-hydroxymyristoyl] N-acetylglucosamine deacetylase [Alphaproteobacteria bacterium]|nr:UDP-3-O-[3-hydroxymyristoyl] N-acetylglucosamine deacetylase [Alphaproteobacteria bacterium]
MVRQRTLRAATGCCGIGLHSGQPVSMTLRPAAPGHGIVFRRVDAGADIAALWRNTADATLCTALSNGEGIEIKTIEHVMAALAGCGVDNALVELDAAEVPAMDGSAAPFVALIDRVGTVAQEMPRRAIKVLKPVRIASGPAHVALLPDHSFSMSFEIEFESPVIRCQEMMLGFEPDTFKSELSRARSFCLADEVERMRAAGLARGGSLANAIVVSGDRVLNAGGLRFADEFVRHKLLDAYGDLYLAGGPIIGHFRGSRSGHAQTRMLLAALFADPSAWCSTTLAEPGTLWPPAMVARGAALAHAAGD